VQNQAQKSKVVLIHGIFNVKYCMAWIGRYLKQVNYDVILMGYPSTKYTLQELVEYIHPKITRMIQNNSQPIHFVCHSMGGLLLRAYLEKYPIPNLGRVVFLATPNQGSELADYLSKFKIFQWLFGPAGQQLQTHQTAQVFTKPINFELGVIMGNKPTIRLSCFKGPNDGNVSVESSKVTGMKDHIIVSKNHLTILWDKQAAFQIDYFLQHGVFNKKSILNL
jgi:triacylglycerol lipase